MHEKVFEALPAEIQAQIASLLGDNGKTVDEDERERYARVWSDKYELFMGQMKSVGMEIVEKLDSGDDRGAILLTYSGSLVCLGPAKGGKRWLEYASIKFRGDVPDFVRGQGVSLSGDVAQGAIAEFSGSPLKQSSSLYRIAVCPAGTGETDQEQRIREATIYLTNGFLKINRTVSSPGDSSVEQFTAKSIAAFIAKKHGLTQVASKAIIDDYLSTIEAGVLLGERVPVGKLGAIFLKARAARKARVMKNLATGEDILVPAKPACLVPKFAVSRSLKEKGLLVDPATVTGFGSDDGDDEED